MYQEGDLIWYFPTQQEREAHDLPRFVRARVMKWHDYGHRAVIVVDLPRINLSKSVDVVIDLGAVKTGLAVPMWGHRMEWELWRRSRDHHFRSRGPKGHRPPSYMQDPTIRAYELESRRKKA